jgi:phage regulator Rha-like protein
MPTDFPASQIPAPALVIERRIYLIRGQKVMLDSDLAEIYEVPTKRLNEAVKRNIVRFPEDFMFRLSNEELGNWRSQIATSNSAAKMGMRRPPYAFTEHGVAMLSAVLNSERAVHMSILIVRAFVKLRELAAANKELARKIEEIESVQKRHADTQEQQGHTLQRHTSTLISVLQDIQRLKNSPITRAIGFVARGAKRK